jgi:Leucine-rich repeat (LRR) protein
MKKVSIYLVIILFSCGKVSQDLTTTLTVDPSIKGTGMSTDTTNYSNCWNFESSKMANSNIKSGDGRILFYAIAYKFENQLKIIVEGCTSIVNDYVTIDIVDTSFLVTNTRTSDHAEAQFTPTNQELVINKYPIEYGDTIRGLLKYKGIALIENIKLYSDFHGMFCVVVTGDTSMTYSSISKGIPAADYVHKLKLTGIRDISKLGQFKNLKKLDIIDRSYSGEFPEEILELAHLEDLHLSCNIAYLPEQIDNLSNLKRLDLWGNRLLKKLPATLINCEQLRELNLRQNNSININTLKGLDNLQYLNLAETNISRLPDGILTLQNLQILDISGNTELDFNKALVDLSTMKNLRELELRYCGFKTLPTPLLALKNLKKLNLSWNPLTEGELQRIRCEMPNTDIKFVIGQE